MGRCSRFPSPKAPRWWTCDEFSRRAGRQIEFTIRTGRLIGVAMISGVVLLAAVFALLISQLQIARQPTEIFLYAAILLTVTNVYLSVYLPKLRSVCLNAQTDLAQIRMTFQSTRVIALALCEAAALFSLVAGFVNGRISMEFLIAVVPLAVMFRHIPSTDKFEQFHRDVLHRQT